MRLSRPSHATVVAYLALFFAMSGSAYAATGGTFILGRSNSATSTTGLYNSAGTPLSLTAKPAYPPFKVNQTVKVPRLNADLLDGIDSASLQRRVSYTCSTTQAIRAVGSAGVVTCVNIPMVVGTEVLVSGASCPSGTTSQSTIRLESAYTSGYYYTRKLCKVSP